jgi:membrane protein YqaA with SNARE-associated domain
MENAKAESRLFARLSAYSAAPLVLAAALLWGLAEATFFFIVPDIGIGLIALLSWRKGLWATALALAGALIGGTIMYALALHNAEAASRFLSHIPLIDAELIRSVGVQMRSSGLVAMISGPLQGTPYKIYAVQAGALKLPFLQFLLLSVPARLERILPVAMACCLAGVAFRGFVQRRAGIVVGCYLALWIAVYAFYSWSLR